MIREAAGHSRSTGGGYDQVPSDDSIVACMKRERSKLSPACARVFNPPAAQTATRSLNDPLVELVTEIIRK
jgi:hypothetical protein